MRNALLIDDIKANRLLIRKCLEEEEYEVSAVNNGPDALNLLADRAFDIIFLEMKLNDVSGVPILKAVRECSIQVPIVLFTVSEPEMDPEEYYSYGVIALIKKPVTAERFKRYLVRISEMLHHHSERYEIFVPEEDNADPDTCFAPSEKQADEIILRQSELISKNETLSGLFHLIPNTILILNKQRQIIYSNSYFLNLLGVGREEPVGLRPGEALNCIHAYKDTRGCGTTLCCSVCGAVQAIVRAQNTKQQVTEECLMNYEDGDTTVSRELIITATPADYIEEGATIFIAKDNSSEKLRESMERIFFHDVLNTSGSIKGLAEIAENTSELEEIHTYIGYINESADYLIDEINSQRLLLAAEHKDLGVNISEFSLQDIVQSILRYYSDRKIEFIIEGAGKNMIYSDRALVYRIVLNMIKNAVESRSKEIIIRINQSEEFCDISVHNDGYIDEKIQLQIFKKYFSTKGRGRGIGTYGMKLIGEGLLKGKVWFESTAKDGTQFNFRIPDAHRQGVIRTGS